MPVPSKRIVLAVLAALLAGPASAATGRLSFRQSLYADAADLPLKGPEGVACDDSGALVIADTGNARLLTFTWKDGVLTPGRQIRLQQLPYPTRLQLDRQGDLLVLDRKARRVVRVGAGGLYAGIVEAKGVPTTVSAFRVDGTGGVVLLDIVAGKVLAVGADGKVTRALPLPKGAEGITDVAVDSTGRIFVVDAPSATVYAAEPAGATFLPISKSLKAEISFPTYLAPDNRGKLYVTDQNGHAIVVLGVDGTFLDRALALGEENGALQYPAQLCTTAEGDVIVADRANNRVQIFTTVR